MGLRSWLQNRNSDHREAALRQLCGRTDAEAIPLLVQAFATGGSDVATRVTAALKRFGESAVPAVFPLLANPNQRVSHRVVYVLLGCPTGTEKLAEEYPRLTDSVRRAVISKLGMNSSSPQLAGKIVAQGLADPAPDIRNLASGLAKTYGVPMPEDTSPASDVGREQTPKKPSSSMLSAGLNSSDVLRVVHVAEAKAQDGDTQAIARFTALYRTRQGEESLSAAREMLKLSGDSWLRLLVEEMDTPSADRRKAAWTLDKLGWHPTTSTERILSAVALQQWNELLAIGAPAIPRIMREWLEPPSFDERERWAKLLIQIGGETVVAEMAALLSASESRLRVHAAAFLGRLGDPGATRPLITALGARDPWVRRTAADSLGKIGWNPKTPEQRAFLAVANGDFQAAAKEGTAAIKPLLHAVVTGTEPLGPARALAELGDEAADAILDWYQRSHKEYAGRLILAMSHIRNPQVIEPLFSAAQQTTDDCEFDFAARALIDMGDLRIVPAVIARAATPTLGVACISRLQEVLKKRAGDLKTADLLSIRSMKAHSYYASSSGSCDYGPGTSDPDGAYRSLCEDSGPAVRELDCTELGALALAELRKRKQTGSTK